MVLGAIASLKRVWQTELPFRRKLPSAEFEESIDGCVRSMLRSPSSFMVAPEDLKPWILTRLQFGAGLLQPCNLRMLKMPELKHPERALCFGY